MGALSEIVERNENKVQLPGQTQDIREATIANGARVLQEGLQDKYPALAEEVESDDAFTSFMAAATAVMCERTQRMLDETKEEYGEATVTSALGRMSTRLMDVVRIFYPNQITALITDIQPLDRQTGEIFVIKPKFSNSAAGVTAGSEVFANDTDGTYASEVLTNSLGTGDGSDTTWAGTLTSPVRPGTVKVLVNNTVVATDDGSAGVSGTGVTGSIVYASGVISLTITPAPGAGQSIAVSYNYDSEVSYQNIRELEFGLNMIPVSAKPHPVKIKWSAVANLAASAHLNLDVPDILSNLAAQFIRTERDTNVTNAIVRNAVDHATGGGATNTMTFDASPVAGYGLAQRYGEIEMKLNHGESIINNAMGRGGVSWVIAGFNAAEVFMKSPSFRAVPNPAPIGPVRLGTLRDGTVDLIRVPSMDTNTYVVGYKGYMPGDSAMILADWVPIYFTPIFQAPELYSARGIMSLYDLFINEKNYFVKGKVTNFSA